MLNANVTSRGLSHALALNAGEVQQVRSLPANVLIDFTFMHLLWFRTVARCTCTANTA